MRWSEYKHTRRFEAGAPRPPLGAQGASRRLSLDAQLSAPKLTRALGAASPYRPGAGTGVESSPGGVDAPPSAAVALRLRSLPPHQNEGGTKNELTPSDDVRTDDAYRHLTRLPMPSPRPRSMTELAGGGSASPRLKVCSKVDGPYRLGLVGLV